MAKAVLEIRWHGRGGQGAKTAATMVAEVALQAGKYAQGAPEYGAEREGAPIKAYTRISDRPIRVHDAIYYPDVVLVLDDTLLETEGVADGLTPDGTLLANTPKSPAEVRKKLGLKDQKVYTIDATAIALEEIGRPIPNTVMVGALSKVTGIVNSDEIKKNIKKKLGSKLSEKMLEGNMRAVDRAFDEIRSEQ